MILKSLTFTDDGDVPASAVVEMSIEEMALIFTWIGNTNHTKRNEVMDKGGEIGSDIYGCLTAVFNLFWENGITDYLRSR